MGHGSKKHLTKRERKALALDRRVDEVRAAVMAKMENCKGVCHVDGEPCVNMTAVRILYNELIDRGDTTLEDGLLALHFIYAKSDAHRTVTPCSFCGKRIGVQLCSGCSKTSNIRYCSQECQKAAWPMHKAVCASKHVLDVE